MQRRTFLQALFGGIAAMLGGRLAGTVPSGPPVQATRRSVLLQESQLAGFQYYRGEALWPSLRVGAPLSLVREPENRYDRDAVAVYCGGDKLGFVPQLENRALAQMLDRGERLEARIVALNEDGHPWQRIRMRISLT